MRLIIDDLLYLIVGCGNLHVHVLYSLNQGVFVFTRAKVHLEIRHFFPSLVKRILSLHCEAQDNIVIGFEHDFKNYRSF